MSPIFLSWATDHRPAHSRASAWPPRPPGGWCWCLTRRGARPPRKHELSQWGSLGSLHRLWPRAAKFRQLQELSESWNVVPAQFCYLKWGEKHPFGDNRPKIRNIHQVLLLVLVGKEANDPLCSAPPPQDPRFRDTNGTAQTGLIIH